MAAKSKKSNNSDPKNNDLQELITENYRNYDPVHDKSLCSIIIGGLDQTFHTWDFTSFTDPCRMWQVLLDIN